MNGNCCPWLQAKRGAALLTALVMVTILSLTLAYTIQPAMTAKQRATEQEIIYRGNHLADGIRRFYYLNGRFPFSLNELEEGDRRFVRKVYEDNSKKDGAWILVYLDASNRQQVGVMRGAMGRFLQQTGQIPEEQNSENEADRNPGLSRSLDSVFRIQDRQITGIRPSGDLEGLTLYQESRIYKDWLFTALPSANPDLDEALDNLQNRGRRN